VFFFVWFVYFVVRLWAFTSVWAFFYENTKKNVTTKHTNHTKKTRNKSYKENLPTPQLHVNRKKPRFVPGLFNRL